MNTALASTPVLQHGLTPAQCDAVIRFKALLTSRIPEHIAAVKASNAGLLRLKAITPGVVHVDSALSNLSVQYANAEYIGEQLMPVVPAAHLSSIFYKHDKRSRLAYPDDELGARGSPNELNENLSTDNYSCKGYGYKAYVDNLTLKNQDAPLDEMADVIAMINEGIAFRRELRIAAIMTTAGSYSGNTLTLSAPDQWNATGAGNPIANIQAMRAGLWTGRGQSKLVAFTTLNVMNVLTRHAQILDLFKWGGTKPGLASPDMIAQFFGVDRILVAEARKDTANEAQTAAYARLWPDVFGIVRVATGPSIRNASFGYTFRFGQPNTDQWYDPSLGPMGGYYGRVSVLEDHKIIAPDTGFLLTNPLA